ncbi:NADH-quinone oxidoreductase subunit M [Prevotella pallens ATCC 700821]|uniref:NADH-quinone oxidoreductase subunit M n=1 Tax=Prevotella pallens ATCC 700821 TaxID=997353 RepID=F9DFP2_9BACT|nr:NADH-quinone oxidoreductase subunit M [Prevotella pallens ATCC 700821]
MDTENKQNSENNSFVCIYKILLFYCKLTTILASNVKRFFCSKLQMNENHTLS